MMRIAQNLRDVLQRIDAACQKAGREKGTVRLIAVSKTQPAQAAREAIDAGQTVFGENRVQEAQEKFEGIKKDFPNIQLHLIGPLQTNKVSQAVELFDVIQTVDRPDLIKALAKEKVKGKKLPRLYVEVNIGLEEQKAGVAPDDVGSLIELCESHGLMVEGVMCIPPFNQDPAPYFKELHSIALRNGLKNISMGMSGDYEQAIACGATEVRVGTAIFGSREASVSEKG